MAFKLTAADKQGNGKGSEIAHKLFFRLYQTMNLSLRTASKLLNGVGMSPQQWSILDSLSRPDLREGMTVNGLVEYLMVSRQSLNGVLKRMEQSGYIDRVVNPEDHRSRKIKLTAQGRKVWETAGEKMKQFYNTSLAQMTDEEKLNSIIELENIQRNIRKY